MTLSPAEYNFILKRDFVSFITRSFQKLNPQTKLLMAPYIEAIATKLEDCREGRTTRLIITLPPRYLKSHSASVAFVAWCLGHDPAKQIICASYGQDLADKLARDTRTIMNASWYKSLFSTRLSPDKQAVNDFYTTDTGFRMATSVGGVLTGRGADMILIDDPLKPEEALSETSRKRVNDWFDGTLLSRLNNKAKGVIIIIMQRLHQDDLVGHVLEGPDTWEVVNFPAIAEDDEAHTIESPLGRHVYERKTGEVLHVERETSAMLATTRQRIGDYNFSSQYQQNPIPVGGAMVKTHWLMHYDEPPHKNTFLKVIQSWDTANKSGELNDYSVCTTWGLKDGRYYLLHVFRKRLNYPDLKRAVKDMYGQFEPQTILVEDKASGTQLIQDLESDGVLLITPYVPPAGTDKVMRLHAQTALFEQGRVFLPTQAPWLADYLQELTGFPGSRFDDQVDSTAMALDHLKASSSSLAVWEKLF